jgi:DNA-binding IclR family transcriptional regulator
MYRTSRLAALRNLMLSMERDLGLSDLTDYQRDVYYAAHLVATKDDIAHSDSIRQHSMLSTVPRSTFFRSMKDLVSLGYLVPSGAPRSGEYLVVKRCLK